MNVSNLLHNEKENSSCLFSSLFLAKFVHHMIAHVILCNIIKSIIDLMSTWHKFLVLPLLILLYASLPHPQLFIPISPSLSLSLRQRRIILLSMLTPPLTRDMLIRCNRSTFLLGTNFENYRGNKTHGKGTNGRIAFPCYGCWPPSSCGGPYLKIQRALFERDRE